MLKKSDLKNDEIKKIKAVSVDLLKELEKYLKMYRRPFRNKIHLTVLDKKYMTFYMMIKPECQ